MYLLVIYFPLIGSILSGLLGRFISKKDVAYLATINLFLSFSLSCFIFYETVLSGSICYIKLTEWISINSFNVYWGFMFDTLTSSMLVVVTGVSALVHLYSIEYMKEDPHFKRFMSYLSLFTTFMLILVTSDNYIQLFVGWEGVGICSYLLVNFWFTRPEANQSAIKAVLVNKIGDFSYIMACAAIFTMVHSLDFSTLLSCSLYTTSINIQFFGFETNIIDFIAFFLFVGCIGKSAQIGLHTWLPDAMEGPTPVSALIHAATMVTAGVFLLLRSAPLLELSPNVLNIITVIGGLTSFFAATTGLVQNDLKKVIAYSTCSQLGYMVFACGLSAYSISIFHLANHAFFKALLFLGAGSVIHSIQDEQDMRKMGGLLQIMPITYICIMIGSLSLMGIPFLTGFYSKDTILEFSYSTYTIYAHIGFWLGSFSALLTAYYSTRLLYLTFIKKTSLSKKVVEGAHESGIKILVPLILLFLCSIFIGYLGKELFLGVGTDVWKHTFVSYSIKSTLWDLEFIPLFYKQIPLLFSITGSVFAVYFFYINPWLYNTISLENKKLFFFLSNKYNFDTLYNYYVVNPLMKQAYKYTLSTLDKGYIEILGPYGLSRIVNTLSSLVSKFQTGYIYNYSFIMWVGLILFLIVGLFIFTTFLDIIIYSLIFFIFAIPLVWLSINTNK